MSNLNNSTCSICGKPYYLCVSCKDKIAAAPWKLHCDTAEHYKIYQLVHGYTSGLYTEKEARDRLRNIDISDLSEYRTHIKGIIKGILNGSSDGCECNDDNIVKNYQNDNSLNKDDSSDNDVDKKLNNQVKQQAKTTIHSSVKKRRR